MMDVSICVNAGAGDSDGYRTHVRLVTANEHGRLSTTDAVSAGHR